MELTPTEERLINTLRQIDKNNPLGVDGYTGSYYISFMLRGLDGIPEEAGRRYQLFLKQSQGKAFVDLREAQQPKYEYNDPRHRSGLN